MVSDLQASEKLFVRALNVAETSQDKSIQVLILSRLNVILSLSGNLDKSLQYGIKAIGLYEEISDTAKAGGLYCSIGYSMKRRDMTKAKSYMRTGIDLLESVNAIPELSSAYDNYGVIKEMEEQLDSAKFYYNRSLSIKQSLNDSIGIPYSLNKLAGAYLLEGNHSQAKAYFDQAYINRKNREDNYGIVENLSMYGDYFQSTATWDSSAFYYNSCIVKSYVIAYPYIRQYCYQQLTQVYVAQGNFEKALRAKTRYAELKDSLNSETRTKEIALLETRFETEKKEKENLKLKQETAKQELAISDQRSVIIGLSLGALILLMIAFFVIQRNNQKARTEKDAAIISEREKGLEAIINAAEEERKRIAKDLHDGIVQTLTGLRLKWDREVRGLSGIEDNQRIGLRSSIGILDDAIAETRTISHQMMPRTLSESGLIPAMEDMLEKSLGQTDIAIEFEHHRMVGKRFDESKEISIYRICQELVNNIIKHSEAEAVSVQLLATKTHLVLVVEDNGKGFEYSDTSNRNGIGLMNISSRAAAVQGEVNYQPSPEQGTVATIRIPL